MNDNPVIAIVIPAYNEEHTIADTINEFSTAAPSALIVVIDNNSNDATRELATRALSHLDGKGRLICEYRQGKSNAVRRAFSEVEADVFVMVDADCTYCGSDLERLIAPIVSGEADITVGDRHAHGAYARQNERSFHNFGNNLVRRMINFLFASNLNDILSGYRCFSSLFVKNFPILSAGFELETELTLHALDKRFRIKEIPISYRSRPAGSESKLNTYRDGYRVITTILSILRYNRPFIFFSCISAAFFLFGIAVGAVPILEFYKTARILHVPSAILATGLMLCSLINLAIALILDAVARESRLAFELRLVAWRQKSYSDHHTS